VAEASSTPSPSSAPAVAAGPSESPAESDRLRVTLLEALRRHLVYPRLARQRGWEGTVLLAFELGDGGTISAIRVEQSSGHRVLDLAASKALGQVGRVAVPGVDKDRPLTLPVIFSLTGG